MSNLPALHDALQHVLMTRPYDWQRADQLQKEISMTIARERHALGLIEAAKDLTDGPYRCGYPGCEGGYIWRDACADGQCSDVIQIAEACPVCNAEPTDADYELAAACGLLDDDLPPWAEDYGKGPIDYAALGRLDKQMNREREIALGDLGEPPMPECDDDCISPDEYAALYVA